MGKYDNVSKYIYSLKWKTFFYYTKLIGPFYLMRTWRQTLSNYSGLLKSSTGIAEEATCISNPLNSIPNLSGWLKLNISINIQCKLLMKDNFNIYSDAILFIKLVVYIDWQILKSIRLHFLICFNKNIRRFS